MSDNPNENNENEEVTTQEEEIIQNEETEKIEETAETLETNEDGEKEKDKQKEIENLSGELAKKNEEYDVLYDKYLRVNAEYDNFRKRTAKEKEGLYSDAITDVLKHILPVLDNVERAGQFADSSEPEKVTEGVKMIYTQFLGSLVKIGVEEIIAAGEQFDPEVHYAVLHEEDESQPDNTVTEVLQKGYIKGDKVIRPAMVKVVN